MLGWCSGVKSSLGVRIESGRDSQGREDLRMGLVGSLKGEDADGRFAVLGR